MEKMIQEYRDVYDALKERMAFLRHRLRTEDLRTKERDKIRGRIEVMQAERVDLVHAIAEMKKHL